MNAPGDIWDIEGRDVKKAAAYWAARLSSEGCGPADRAAFAEWRDKDPAHAEAFERTQRGLRAVDRCMGHPDLEAMSKEVLEATAPRAPIWRRWQGAAIAASVALVIAVSAVLLASSMNDRSARIAALQGEYYETAIGERSTIVLVDGSTVTLNTNSRIEVDFDEGQRDVALIRGQALFEVAKDPARPFIVEAGNQRITAIGTAFDVRFDKGDEVKVVLVEGRVAVDELVNAAAANAPALVPEKRIEMTAGEVLVAAANVERAVQAADIEEATSWRNGRLLFRAKPLGEVIEEVNRYSVAQLRLSDDPRLEDIVVSGVFNAGQSESFVVAIGAMHAIDAQRTAKDEITLVWRE